MKRLIYLLTAIVLSIVSINAVTVYSASESVLADKTAQWTAQEKDAGYDLRIHGWSTWETAAYIGFTLPAGFNSDNISEACLTLNTTWVKNSGTAYLYAADYSSFESGMQYEGTGAPSYNETEILSFTSPSLTGDFIIDITDYIKSISNDTSNIAFRIDVKSQNTNNDWCIGSLTNDASAPVIEFEYGQSPIINSSFSSGIEGWTIDNTSNMTVSDGKLIASGNNYKARISQTITNLENGTYDLTAYTTSTDIDGIAYLYAKTYGHTMAMTAIPQTSAEIKISVPGICVENGTCDIGMYVEGSSSITLDRLSLVQSEQTRVPFLKGGEISKLTYVEDKNAKFYFSDGSEGDALQIMAENGFNLARIRILNHPGKGRGDGTYYLPEGYQDEADCLEMARRAHDKGMQILFSFAYSDTWSDGNTQIIPHDWQDYIEENNLSDENLAVYLENQVYEFTKDIMNKLIAQGTCPEFVSIGNEIQMGLLFGTKSNHNNWYGNSQYLARFCNAGARAVRETSPDTKIVLHSDGGGKILSSRPYFVNILSQVDFDVIGVSYYPFYDANISIDTVVNEFASLINTYDKDVIIMETGYNWNPTKPDGYDGQLEDSGYYQDIYGESQDGQRAFLTELYAKLKQVLGGRCIGDLYWDPVMLYKSDYSIGWAIRESDDYPDGNVVPNSTIFDFDGVEVAGQQAMKYNVNSTDNVMISGNITNKKGTALSRQINVYVNGAIYSTTSDKFGKYIISVPYPDNEEFSIYAQGMTGIYNIPAPYDGVLIDDINFTENDDTIKNIETSLSEDGKINYVIDCSSSKGTLFVAAYNSDGILTSCRINSKNGSFNSEDTSTISAYLWDENMNSLCSVYTK